MKASRIILAMIPLALASPALAQGTAEQRAACGPDAFRLCASSIPNAGRVAACLRQQRGSLSAACRTVFDESDTTTQQTAEAPPPPPRAKPAPRLAEPARPAPRIAAAPERTPPVRERIAQRGAAPPPVVRQVVERRSTPARVAAGPAARTRTVTKVVYVYVPTASTRRQPAVRRTASRRSRGGGGYGSDMAQAMYWMRTVSGYAGSMGYGSLDGLSSESFAGLLQ